MSNAVQLAPRGRTFVRGAIAWSQAKHNAEAYALNRWGAALAPAIAKAAVPASVADAPGTPEAREFFALATEQALIGRIPGLRRVAFNTRSLVQLSGAVAGWVTEGKPIPVVRGVNDDFTLPALKVGSIIVQTSEAIRAAGNVAEAALQRDLLRAVSSALDMAFIDPSNAGSADESPASVTYGQTQIASTGSAKRDIEAMFGAYRGSYASAAVVMAPRTAVQIGLLAEQIGMTKLGVTGGTLAGVPVYCSEAMDFGSAGGTITLLDADAIAYGARDFDLETTDEAALQMRNDPVDGAAQLVSLFQANCTAWRAIGTANWEVQGDGRVVSITGADYVTGA